ncbi:hypothetical protein F5884DRAFT_303892 [Xylogone sp. PMI_703]|nr:hypothetical protein F5884DRAFT_303892 [Xylogone sp. PMI_703]
MASKKLYDPLILLRIAPLLSSTCSLWYALDQSFFLSIFTNPIHCTKSNDILPSYFTTFFHHGVWRVLGLISISIATSVANLYHAGLSDELRKWFVAGALFTASHLLFVPAEGPTTLAIIHNQSKGRSTEDLKRWLKIHLVRTLTVDLAAWACFVVAAVS